MHTVRSRSIAVLALVLLAAACGSSSPSATPKAVRSTAAPTTAAPSTAPPTTNVKPTTTTTPPTVPPTYAPAVVVTVPPTVPVTAPPTTAAPVRGIKLVGETGVSPAQLHRAEVLLTSTIAALKQFATPALAYAAGYRSIGDAATGDEHYTNWSYVDDGHILDPQRPESVVFEYRNGKQTAVAAMYALPFGSSFRDVPDVGGSLTQWHVHRDICLTTDPQNRVVSGIVGQKGKCPPGTSKAGNTPMLHVWRIPNPCGPFASLEGIGAGQVPAGQTRNCDTSNASVP